MRLLHWTDQGLGFEDVVDPSEYRYAILSHRWHDDGEIMYADILAYPHGPVTGWTLSADNSGGQLSVPRATSWQKLRHAMQQTKKDGLDYLWVDTCCIDKTSSAELSESINSMYAWYQQAVGCYAYLSDVPGDCPVLTDASEHHWKHAFVDSVWFGRGWTLQELIAPKIVHFFGAEWNYLGVMTDLVQTIAGSTAVHSKLLSGECELEAFSMAQRLSWMAGRKTTRIEDEAYCLLGLLGVNMPLLYGEGRRAFTRLQEEVIRSNDDLSIFAWNAPGAEDPQMSRFSLFAPSPASFTGCEGMWRTRGYSSGNELHLTNVSMQGTLRITPCSSKVSDADNDYTFTQSFIPLDCELGSDFSRVVALTVQRLKRSQAEQDSPYLIVHRAWSSPFLPGLDRLSIINPSHWVAARRRTITLLKQPPLSADGRLTSSDGSYSLEMIRVGTSASPLLVFDIYPRDCVYAPPPATMPWRTAQALTDKRPVIVQRSRSAVTGIHVKLGYTDFYIVLVVDQDRNDLARSLPSFKGTVRICHTTVANANNLRSACERYIRTESCDEAFSELVVGPAAMKARLSGTAEAAQPIMTLELIATL
ncbi:hypothetical protein B0A48_04094 [Cryoendolithus antarcticus]|uniref:Uncharacterized protein n=1 Tax=Cryoendolithus antarcticus TaxID=1507870 RepID=A0A1V8THN4_9PEZI|nr:hypothetical protein B0A48_04094 [Cryoendolithus antarcticus]